MQNLRQQHEAADPPDDGRGLHELLGEREERGALGGNHERCTDIRRVSMLRAEAGEMGDPGEERGDAFHGGDGVSPRILRPERRDGDPDHGGRGREDGDGIQRDLRFRRGRSAGMGSAIGLYLLLL